MPTVDDVRPASCPGCGTASRPVGGPLQLWGHGIRERLCLGPPAPGQKPQTTSVDCRRYQCQVCSTVVLVVPHGVARRKHYATTAIAWALALLGLCGFSFEAIRRAISVWALPNGDLISTWKTLLRWIGDLEKGTLFAELAVSTDHCTPKESASRAATALLGRAPPWAARLPKDRQAFLGGAQMI